MAPWENQLLNISVRIGTNMCGSLKYTLLGKPFNPGNLLRPTNFNASQTSHSVTKPSQLAASASLRPGGKLNSYETPEPEVKTASKAITEVRPTDLVHLTIRSEHVSVWGLDRFDIPERESSYFFLTRGCVAFYRFIRNSFEPRSNYVSLLALSSLMPKFPSS